MVKKLLFYSLLVLVSAVLAGCILSGKVTTSSGESLEGVSMVLNGNANLSGAIDLTTSTGSSGEYEFEVPDEFGSYTITPSLYNFKFNPESWSGESNAGNTAQKAEGIDFTATKQYRIWEDGNETGHSVQQTTDGGYIIAGETTRGTGYWSALLIKTDAAGNEEWNKTFGWEDESFTMVYSVQQTTDGGFILAGNTHLYGDPSDLLVIKTDAAGNEEWHMTYGEWRDYDGAYSIQQTTDGGYIVAGYTVPYQERNDVLLLKIGATGNYEWKRTFGGFGYDRAYSVQQTADGGYIVAGGTESFSVLKDFWVIKTGPTGNEEWNKTYGGNGHDEARSIQQTTDGGYIIAGMTRSYGEVSDTDFWVIKTDAAGNEEWDKVFGGSNFDNAYSVQQTTDGGYIVAGATDSYDTGNHDAWLIKTDTAGNEEWQKVFGDSTSYDKAYSVQQTTDGGYIMTGATKLTINHVWLVKTDADGNHIPFP